jgi:hypothetical protein
MEAHSRRFSNMLAVWPTHVPDGYWPLLQQPDMQRSLPSFNMNLQCYCRPLFFNTCNKYTTSNYAASKQVSASGPQSGMCTSSLHNCPAHLPWSRCAAGGRSPSNTISSSSSRVQHRHTQGSKPCSSAWAQSQLPTHVTIISTAAASTTQL